MSDSIRYIAPYGLRMSPQLKERIQKAADRERRSLNFTICEALEQAFPDDANFIERKAS